MEDIKLIEKIRIKDVASYDSTGIEINLNKINYIYGSNGTGKTTISELLRSKYDDISKFSSCSIEKRQDVDIFVYNRHFVEKNFSTGNNIKGIFTLGEESTEILAYIDEKNKDIEKHKEKVAKLDDHIKEKKEDLKILETKFMDQCWSLKKNMMKISKRHLHVLIAIKRNLWKNLYKKQKKTKTKYVHMKI